LILYVHKSVNSIASFTNAAVWIQEKKLKLLQIYEDGYLLKLKFSSYKT